MLLQWTLHLSGGNANFPTLLDVRRIMQRPLEELSKTSIPRPKKRLWRTAGCAGSASGTLPMQSNLVKAQHPSQHAKFTGARYSMPKTFMK
jgi:hypothetical protein